MGQTHTEPLPARPPAKREGEDRQRGLQKRGQRIIGEIAREKGTGQLQGEGLEEKLARQRARVFRNIQRKAAEENFLSGGLSLQYLESPTPYTGIWP